MIYLSDEHVQKIGINWELIIKCLKEAVGLLQKKEFAQPIKPYLRYKDPVNRIIAMPAYLGGNVNKAGIKWIASFPNNIEKGLTRAHSVTILNEADTGIPFCIINSTKVSIIRTAGISALLLDNYLRYRTFATKSLRVGITGWGPIGRMHFEMVTQVCGDRLDKVLLYDIRSIDLDGISNALKDKIEVVSSWQEAYTGADIFITCTVSKEPYINLAPKPGSLQMNISLRDYMVEMRRFMDIIIVDDWDEVCRQKTDIEMMHEKMNLQQADTCSLSETSLEDIFSNLDDTKTVMFNPMGMAIFDIAIAWHYCQESKKKNVMMSL